MNKTWKPGDKVVCNGNHEAVVLRHYSGNMYEVRLRQGFRIVGEVCVDGNDLQSRK